jgi:hypothetical protein
VFEQFVARCRNGAYAQLRGALRAGMPMPRPLETLNWLLLEVAKHIDLIGGRSLAVDASMSVARHWQKAHGSKPSSKRQAGIAILGFVFVASSWMRSCPRTASRRTRRDLQ